MKHVRIYLKAGQTIDLWVDDFVVEKNERTKELVRIEWKSADIADKLRLVYLAVDQIAAITGLEVTSQDRQ